MLKYKLHKDQALFDRVYIILESIVNGRGRMEDILSKNVKAIVHLRQQLRQNRTGLVFGAGISYALGFPFWDPLIKGIAMHSMVDAKELYDSLKSSVSQSSITEVLFQYFKTNRERELKTIYENDDYFLQKRLLSDWRSVIHDVLYADAMIEREEKVKSHPYLNDLIPIIQQSEVTINYNFDDTIEYMLSQKKSEKAHKPYQTVWHAHAQYKTDTPVIYHLNGFLPGDINSQQSEELVFSEESFSDQLIDSMSGKSSAILNQFGKKTCLMVGLSLDDVTLKHLLRQSTKLSSGNYHYFIRYTENGKLTESEKKAIYKSNFAVYNLITLFFDSKQISEFSKLLTMESDEFQLLAEKQGVKTKMVHYFVGSVAVGKSSILSHFGNFQILEEWVDDRPSLLTKPFKSLDKKEKEKVDSWINGQFAKKNNWLHKQKEGIFLVDRTPLDPLSFSNDDDEAKERALSMLEAIQPGQSKRVIAQGNVIYLESDPKEQRGRLLTKRKLDWDEDFLKELNSSTYSLYEKIISSHLKNNNKPLSEIISDTAKLIFCEEYYEKDLHSHLLSFVETEGIT